MVMRCMKDREIRGGEVMRRGNSGEARQCGLARQWAKAR